MPETNPHSGPPTSPYDTYTSPLAARNASPEMCRLWSPRHKFQTWRRIWLAVAEAQYEVTKDWDKPLVAPEQIEELRANLEVTDDDLRLAEKYEAELRHDVMAHVHAWGDKCPKARPIIHLGMTSQDVVCNADVTVLRESWAMLERKVLRAIISLSESADKAKILPTLGFTHYQSAQPTTVGRRIALWAHDLYYIYDERIELGDPSLYRGFRGATGTQASFLALFDNDINAVDSFEGEAVHALLRTAMGKHTPPPEEESYGDYWKRLFESKKYLNSAMSMFDKLQTNEDEIARVCGLNELEKSMFKSRWLGSHAFERDIVDQHNKQLVNNRSFLSSTTFHLTGQTYPRAMDTLILADLASIAAVLHKIATDIRLLSNRKEIDEPFGKNQIGSSAMPYKRNPMKCERICGLARFVMNLVGNAYDTAATQWLERTLDDSSNRRLSLPEAFLALDGALDLMHQVASGLVVHEAMVRKNLMAELPFLATENILMEAVKLGGDRQDLHEKIRVHAQAAGMRVKQEGLDNDLIERLRKDPAFKSVHHLLTEDQLLDPMKYIGRSVEQTERFLREVVEPLRERYGEELEKLGSSDRGV